MVGFHHQSLLIAALWPGGKGNVSYGANVGSNHTGKVADQEIRPGEGVFFGLGTNIKFPSNFEEAPYSLIASGVTTLPQRVRFPFSLIMSPTENISSLSSAINEILPAWILYESEYTYFRNENKFIARGAAYASELIYKPKMMLLRADNIKHLISARNLLVKLGEDYPRGATRHCTSKKVNVYTSDECDGLGKNFMTDNSRIKAIEGYSFFIRYYALQGLYDILSFTFSRDGNLDALNLVSLATTNSKWRVEMEIIKEEYPGKSIKDLMEAYISILQHLQKTIIKSKDKDAKRGRLIIDDYDEAHTSGAEDPVAIDMEKRYMNAMATVALFLPYIASEVNNCISSGKRE
jgi:hypothetical protein